MILEVDLGRVSLNRVKNGIFGQFFIKLRVMPVVFVFVTGCVLLEELIGFDVSLVLLLLEVVVCLSLLDLALVRLCNTFFDRLLTFGEFIV